MQCVQRWIDAAVQSPAVATRLERRQRRARRWRVNWAAAAVAVVLFVLASMPAAVRWLGGGGDHPRIVTAPAATGTSRPAPTSAPPTSAAPTTTTLPPPPGVAPRVDHVETTDRVVFITIDDGWHPLPDVFAFLQAHQAPVSAFLIAPIARRDAEFYRQVLTLGGTVEDHTMHHPNLARLSLGSQTTEFCQAADLVAATFGRRPLLARPPYGSENQYTDQAIGACGMYVTVLWDATFSNHGFRLTHPGGLRPGDIILMHWGPGLLQDLQTLFPLLDATGLRPAPLQDYLGPTATHASTMPPAPLASPSESPPRPGAGP